VPRHRPSDRPDLANPGYFTKKSSNFIEINPQFGFLSQKILQKKTLDLTIIKPQSMLLNGPACLNGPKTACEPLCPI
jgi:hypothetical protein